MRDETIWKRKSSNRNIFSLHAHTKAFKHCLNLVRNSADNLILLYLLNSPILLPFTF